MKNLLALTLCAGLSVSAFANSTITQPVFSQFESETISEQLERNADISMKESFVEGAIHHINSMSVSEHHFLARIDSGNTPRFMEMSLNAETQLVEASTIINSFYDKPEDTLYTYFSDISYVGNNHVQLVVEEQNNQGSQSKLLLLKRASDGSFDLVNSYTNEELGGEYYSLYARSEAKHSILRIGQYSSNSGFYILNEETSELEEISTTGFNTSYSELFYHEFTDTFYATYSEYDTSLDNVFALKYDPTSKTLEAVNSFRAGDSNNYYQTPAIIVDSASSRMLVRQGSTYEVVEYTTDFSDIATFSADSIGYVYGQRIAIHGEYLVIAGDSYNQDTLTSYSYEGGQVTQVDSLNLQINENDYYSTKLYQLHRTSQNRFAGLVRNEAIVQFELGDDGSFILHNILQDGDVTSDKLNGGDFISNEAGDVQFIYNSYSLSLITRSEQGKSVTTFDIKELLDSNYFNSIEMSIQPDGKLIVLHNDGSQLFLSSYLVDSENQTLTRESRVTFLNENSETIYPNRFAVSSDISRILIASNSDIYWFAIDDTYSVTLSGSETIEELGFTNYYSSQLMQAVDDKFVIYDTQSSALHLLALSDEGKIVIADTLSNLSENNNVYSITSKDNRAYISLAHVLASIQVTDMELELLSYSAIYRIGSDNQIVLLSPYSAAVTRSDELAFYAIDKESGVWKRTHGIDSSELPFRVDYSTIHASNDASKQSLYFANLGYSGEVSSIYQYQIQRAPIVLQASSSVYPNIGQLVSHELGQYFTDLDDSDTISFSSAQLPNGAAITGDFLVLEPSGDDAQVISIKATDMYGLSSTIDIDYSVNLAPELVNTLPTITVEEDSSVLLELSEYFTDVDGLTFSATGLPTGVTITSNGVIHGSPNLEGTSSVSITVTDDLGASTQETMQIVVTAKPKEKSSGSIPVQLSLILLGLFLVRRFK